MIAAFVTAGVLGGIIALLVTFAISLIPNTFAMWVVVKMELGKLADKASFWNCFLCTLLITLAGVLWFVIAILAVIFLPLAGMYLFWLCFLAWIATAKAIIEGLFEISEGSATILFLYICFTAFISYYVIPAMLGDTNVGQSSSRSRGGATTYKSPEFEEFVDEEEVEEVDAPLAVQSARIFPDAHSGIVYAVAYLSQTEALSAGADGRIAMWDLVAGSQTRTFAPGHRGAVQALDVTPDGRFAVSGGADGMVCVWDVASGSVLRQSAPAQQHRGVVTSVAINPRAESVVSGGEDGRVLYWDLASDRTIPYAGHKNIVTAVDYSPDGYLVASGSIDRSIQVINFVDQTPPLVISGLGQVLTLEFAPDRRHLLAGTLEGELHWIDLAKFVGGSDAHEMRTIAAHGGTGVLSVDIADEAGFAITGGMDNKVYVWEFADDVEKIVPLGTMSHDSLVRTVRFSPDMREALSAGDDRSLRRWDLFAPPAGN